MREQGFLLTLIFPCKGKVVDFVLIRENTGQWKPQKQPPRGVPRKRYSENMQQIYKRTPMPKCDTTNLLHIFRITFLKNTSGRLLLRPVFWHILLSDMEADAVVSTEKELSCSQLLLAMIKFYELGTFITGWQAHKTWILCIGKVLCALMKAMNLMDPSPV